MLRDPDIAPREPGRLYCFSTSNLYASGVAAVRSAPRAASIGDFTELATEKTPRGVRRGRARTR